MIHRSLSRRTGVASRAALGLALALGVAAGGAVSTPAFAQKAAAPKLKLSKPFTAVAAPLQGALEAAKAKPEVTAAKAQIDAANAAQRAATTPAARQQAQAQSDAAHAAMMAALAPEKAQLDAAFAAIAGEDDRFMAGNLAVNFGGLAQDPATQKRGLDAMLQSGKVNPADVARFRFFSGQISYQLRDYAGAQTALQEAVNAGYKENDAEALLAEAYIANNQVPQGLTVLKAAMDARRAAGTPAPVGWYRRGLGAAYKAQLLDKASEFAMALVQAYPTKDNWAGAITVVREIGKFPAQETLDLMRLMDRTNSYVEERDYIEYIQAADPRRLPGEAQKVIEKGLAAGKLRANDTFVTDSRAIASQRVAADRASLVALERDARAGSATSATVSGAADAFLSYGDAAKAAELYQIALGKPGADAARVLTRMGIAQLDLGKYAEAQATFARVDGPRKALAQLWSIYAGQKAAGGA
jgi:hypothetical protein